MNCCSKQKILILGIGRLVRTEYRVLLSIRYSAEPSNRTEYRFSPIQNLLLLNLLLPNFLRPNLLLPNLLLPNLLLPNLLLPNPLLPNFLLPNLLLPNLLFRNLLVQTSCSQNLLPPKDRRPKLTYPV